MLIFPLVVFFLEGNNDDSNVIRFVMIYEFYGRWPNFKGVQQNFFWISTKAFVNLHKHSELSIKKSYLFASVVCILLSCLK